MCGQIAAIKRAARRCIRRDAVRPELEHCRRHTQLQRAHSNRTLVLCSSWRAANCVLIRPRCACRHILPSRGESSRPPRPARCRDLQTALPQTSRHTSGRQSTLVLKALPSSRGPPRWPGVTCLSHLLFPQAPGRHPQPFPISSFPYTTPSPVRSTSLPHLCLCMQLPACHLSALVFALSPSLSPKLWSLKRFLRDLGITGPSRRAFTLLGPDFIYQISL